MSGKQCGIWSDGALCGIWSGSTQFAQACLHWRQFAGNVKSYFLGKLRKNISVRRLLKILPSMLSVKRLNTLSERAVVGQVDFDYLFVSGQVIKFDTFITLLSGETTHICLRLYGRWQIACMRRQFCAHMRDNDPFLSPDVSRRGYLSQRSTLWHVLDIEICHFIRIFTCTLPVYLVLPCS